MSKQTLVKIEGKLHKKLKLKAIQSEVTLGRLVNFLLASSLLGFKKEDIKKDDSK